jgi:DNA (cytosine-5)-methyltransferase 1
VAPNDLVGYTQCHFFAGIGVWSYALRCAGWSDDRPIWTGSCPCQPFSAAGKGGGFADERHLWPSFHHLIRECQPATVIGEQVASKHGLGWFDLVSTDMDASGYACGAVVADASSFGAWHKRQRIYWAANAKWHKQPRQEPRRWADGRMGRVQQPIQRDTDWQAALSKLRVLDDGHPRCVGLTDAARNALYAPQAQAFIESIMTKEDANETERA